MRWYVFLVIALAPAVSGAGELRAVDGRFVDARGATVILRGVDVAGNSKVPPFRPAADPTIFDPLPTWGLNAVRLLFTWEAYEPQPGQYDDSYLAYYVGAVRAAEARGLYVLVDFHQDAFARALIGGCGEGFPFWAIPAAIPRATPDNGADCSDWGARLLADDDVHTTWSAFYSDSEGARARYLIMIQRVAQMLAGEPRVVGYDLLNEPYGDEVSQIGPLYELAAPSVRAADATAIVFLSPQVLTGAGNPTFLPKPTFINFAYSPHYYDPSVLTIHTYTGAAPDDPFRTMTGTAAAWGAPLFLGEFGAPPSTDGIADYMDTLYAHLDGALASGTQWVYTPGWTAAAKDGWDAEDFSIVDDRGQLRANFHPRPFARRIAGTPTALTVTGANLTLTWTNDPLAGATEVFAPTGTAHATGGVSCARMGAIISCTAGTAGPKTLRIAPDGSSCGLTGAEPLLLLLLLGWIRGRRGRPFGVATRAGRRDHDHPISRSVS